MGNDRSGQKARTEVAPGFNSHGPSLMVKSKRTAVINGQRVTIVSTRKAQEPKMSVRSRDRAKELNDRLVVKKTDDKKHYGSSTEIKKRFDENQGPGGDKTLSKRCCPTSGQLRLWCSVCKCWIDANAQATKRHFYTVKHKVNIVAGKSLIQQKQTLRSILTIYRRYHPDEIGQTLPMETDLYRYVKF